jgi:hypothetical protein
MTLSVFMWRMGDDVSRSSMSTDVALLGFEPHARLRAEVKKNSLDYFQIAG